MTLCSAESIIDALKANEELDCEGIEKVGCPSTGTHHSCCMGNPDECDECINQLCKQSVSVHHKYKKLITLNFRFMVSLQNHGGFIRMDDSALNKLISHNYINKDMLKSVKQD